MNVDEIYTPIGEAREEIKRRWNDPVLKKKVEEFLGGDVPEIFKREPHAVLVRDIVTPNNEFRYFWDMITDLELKPIFIEYLDSKFVTKNVGKYHLCKMYFNEGEDKNGQDIITSHNLVDFNTMEGKPLNTVTTVDGENLVTFHHNLLKKAYPSIGDGDMYNFYSWFNEHRNIDEYYYLHYLALFICHGVLFDNFITGNGEKDFTEKKILPSIKKLTEIFGIKPLIVPATPIKHENNLSWWFYPGKIKELMESGSYNREKTVIKDTGKYGAGVFATEAIKKGTLITKMTGDVISEEECWNRINKGEETLSDPLQIDLKTYIDLDPYSRSFNHSCDPNTAIINDNDMLAIKDIGFGEEITYDYSATVGPNVPVSEWSMECKCGSPLCRHTISNVLSLSPEQLRFGVGNKYLQNYIIEVFK